MSCTVPHSGLRDLMQDNIIRSGAAEWYEVVFKCADKKWQRVITTGLDKNKIYCKKYDKSVRDLSNAVVLFQYEYTMALRGNSIWMILHNSV